MIFFAKKYKSKKKAVFSQLFVKTSQCWCWYRIISFILFITFSSVLLTSTLVYSTKEESNENKAIESSRTNTKKTKTIPQSKTGKDKKVGFQDFGDRLPLVDIKLNNVVTEDRRFKTQPNSPAALESFSKHNKYQPYFEIGGAKYFNQKSKVAGIYDLFIPLLQTEDQLFFTDLRIFDRSGSSSEANVHLGYRKLLPNTNEMFGIYGAYDYRKSVSTNSFNQLTFGVEYWRNRVFIGGNFYVPLGIQKKVANESASSSTRGLPIIFDDITVIQNTEKKTVTKAYDRIMPGADAEVGYAITDSLTSYIGGYYFAAHEADTMVGPKIRLTYDYQKRNGRILWVIDGVSIEAGAQYDNVRKASAYLGLRFKIGLVNFSNNSNISGFERHMVELVRRDPDIVVGKVQSEDIKETTTYNISETKDEDRPNKKGQRAEETQKKQESIQGLLDQLELKRDATWKDVQKQVIKSHPDHGGNNETFQRYLKAYEELKARRVEFENRSINTLDTKQPLSKTDEDENKRIDKNEIRKVLLGAFGLSESATARDVAKQYHELSRLYHPDKSVGNKEEAGKKFRNYTALYNHIKEEFFKETVRDFYTETSSYGSNSPYMTERNSKEMLVVPSVNVTSDFKTGIIVIKNNKSLSEAKIVTQGSDIKKTRHIYNLFTVNKGNPLKVSNVFMGNQTITQERLPISTGSSYLPTLGQIEYLIFIPTRIIDIAVNQIFEMLLPIKPVEAGGIGYVLEKIGREIGRVLKQIFRFLNKANGGKPVKIGPTFDFGGDGRPRLKDIEFTANDPHGNEVKYRVYERKKDDGSTTWSTESQLPKEGPIKPSTAPERENEKQKIDLRKPKPCDIDTRDAILKAFNLFVNPQYQPQEYGWLYRNYRDAKSYVYDTVYNFFGKEYLVPYEYYDYGYNQKLEDARDIGTKLSGAFEAYDRYLTSSNEYSFLDSDTRLKHQKYETERWDKLNCDTAQILFQNGMWNDMDVRNSFKQAFKQGYMATKLADANDEYFKSFIDKRLWAIETNLQNELEAALKKGYDILEGDVDAHINKYLDSNALDGALRIIANNPFKQDFKEAAKELLEANVDDFEPILGRKWTVYSVQLGDYEYSSTYPKVTKITNSIEGHVYDEHYEYGPSVVTPQDFINDLKKHPTLSNDWKEKIDSILKATPDIIQAYDYTTATFDFLAAKKSIVKGAILGGAATFGACELVCEGVCAATGGLIGATAGGAGAPPGIIVGAELGAVQCPGLCFAFSAAGATAGIVYNFDSEDSDKAYYSKSVKEKKDAFGKIRSDFDTKVQKHHIASPKNKDYTKDIKRVTDKYSFNLNGEENFKFLPEKAEKIVDGKTITEKFHMGRHTNKYHERIIEELRSIDKTITEEFKQLTQAQKDQKFVELFHEKIAKNVEKILEKTKKVVETAKEVAKELPKEL